MSSCHPERNSHGWTTRYTSDVDLKRALRQPIPDHTRCDCGAMTWGEEKIRLQALAAARAATTKGRPS